MGPGKGSRRARGRRIAIVGLGVAIYVLVVLQAAAITAKKASHAKIELSAAEAAAKDGHLDVARAHIQAASRDISVTRSPLIRAILVPPKYIPFLGGSFRFVDNMTGAAADVLKGARILVDSLGPLTVPGALKLEDGRIPVVPWADLASAAERATTHLGDAEKKLADIPTSGVPSKLLSLRASLRGEIGKSGRALSRLALGAEAAARIFDGRDRTVLVILQNSSELRATGGYPDGLLTFRITSNRFRIEQVRFDTGLPPAQVPDFRRLLTNPDFPTSAREVAAFASRVWSIDSDLVLSLDTVGLSSLFKITGPVTVDDVRLDQNTYVRWSTVTVYEQHPDPTDRHLFEARVIQALMDKLLDGSPSFSKLGATFGEMAVQKHFLLWSPDPEAQTAFEGLEVSARFAPVPGEATLAVFGNALDREWSKLAPFSKRSIVYSGELASDGMLRADLSVTISNDAPDLPEYLLGPLGDYVYRTNVQIEGFTASPTLFAVPRGKSVTKSFRTSVKTSPGHLVLHYVRQPLMQTDRVEIRISVPRGVRIREARGLTYTGGVLTFRGELASDRIFDVRYDAEA